MFKLLNLITTLDQHFTVMDSLLAAKLYIFLLIYLPYSDDAPMRLMNLNSLF